MSSPTQSNFKPSDSRHGFTLLELLIIIVVVGLLAFFIYPRLVSGPISARDADRKKDLAALRAGLESYYTDKGSYPTSLNDLVSGATPYVKPPLPSDPKTHFVYTYTPTGQPASSYVLVATLENTRDKDIKKGSKTSYEVLSAN